MSFERLPNVLIELLATHLNFLERFALKFTNKTCNKILQRDTLKDISNNTINNNFEIEFFKFVAKRGHKVEDFWYVGPIVLATLINKPIPHHHRISIVCKQDIKHPSLKVMHCGDYSNIFTYLRSKRGFDLECIAYNRLLKVYNWDALFQLKFNHYDIYSIPHRICGEYENDNRSDLIDDHYDLIKFYKDWFGINLWHLANWKDKKVSASDEYKEFKKTHEIPYPYQLTTYDDEINVLHFLNTRRIFTELDNFIFDIFYYEIFDDSQDMKKYMDYDLNGMYLGFIRNELKAQTYNELYLNDEFYYNGEHVISCLDPKKIFNPYLSTYDPTREAPYGPVYEYYKDYF